MANTIIEIKGISKSFQGNSVLEDINLTVKEGEFLTLLGPSGCGKTTLLRIISGLENPDQGQLLIGGKNCRGLSPQERHVNTVFQSYALFPHMTVFDNVAFGLRCQHLPKAEIETRVNAALQMVKLQKYSQRKPEKLSGGQQQRVAIARAVVNRPIVLLLDEPLSALDYRLRKNMQLELKQLQRQLNIAFVFVTHDQEEALSMSDRVVVMHEGKVEQIGTPRQVYENPANMTVAHFVGETNSFDSRVIEVLGKTMTVDIQGQTFTVKNTRDYAPGDHVHVLVRPEDLKVWSHADVTDTTNMLPATVTEVIYKGSTVDLMVRLSDNTLLAASEFFDEDDEKLEYTIGEKVWLHWFPGWEVVLPYEA